MPDLEHVSAPFSSPEPTILLACGRARELWVGLTPEVRDSRNECSAYTQKIGSGQSSRALPQARRIVSSGDENGISPYCPKMVAGAV